MLPKTQQAAASLALALKGVVYNAVPRIEAAVVVDIANYQTLGYVIASSGRGQVQVFGVPIAAAARGIRIYIQAAGPEKNQRFIYSATAGTCVTGGASSGAIVAVNPTAINGSGGNTGNNHYPIYPGTAHPQVTLAGQQYSTPGGLGYFWSFFTQFPTLPSSSACLFDFQADENILGAIKGQGIRCTVESDGTVVLHYYTDFVSYNYDYATYRSVNAITAGDWHYIVWQIGAGSNGQALYLDGYSTTGLNQPIWTSSGVTAMDFPTMSAPYNVTFFNSFTTSMACPSGTLLSKFQFGVDLNSGSVQPPFHGVPTQDSQISNGRQPYNQGLRTLDLWLNQYVADFAAAPAPGTIPVSYPDSGAEANYLTFDGYYITGQAAGPY